jgi:hypothetical protein
MENDIKKPAFTCIFDARLKSSRSRMASAPRMWRWSKLLGDMSPLKYASDFRPAHDGGKGPKRGAHGEEVGRRIAHLRRPSPHG